MKKFFLKKFSSFLIDRNMAKDSLDIFLKQMDDVLKKEKVFFDFSEVRVLTPSFCDEFFTDLVKKYPENIIIDENILHAFKVAFETVEETTEVKFNFGKFEEDS